MILFYNSDTSSDANIADKIDKALLALYQNDINSAINYLQNIKNDLQYPTPPEIDWNDTSLRRKQ